MKILFFNIKKRNRPGPGIEPRSREPQSLRITITPPRQVAPTMLYGLWLECIHTWYSDLHLLRHFRWCRIVKICRIFFPDYEIIQNNLLIQDNLLNFNNSKKCKRYAGFVIYPVTLELFQKFQQSTIIISRDHWCIPHYKIPIPGKYLLFFKYFRDRIPE